MWNILKSCGRPITEGCFEVRRGKEGVKGVVQVKEGLRVLCKLLSKKEVHYKMLSSGVWLPAKPLLSSLQLRAFEASHQWVCLNCLGMRPRWPADVSAAGSAAGQSHRLTARRGGVGVRGWGGACMWLTARGMVRRVCDWQWRLGGAVQGFAVLRILITDFPFSRAKDFFSFRLRMLGLDIASVWVV